MINCSMQVPVHQTVLLRAYSPGLLPISSADGLHGTNACRPSCSNGQRDTCHRCSDPDRWRSCGGSSGLSDRSLCATGCTSVVYTQPGTDGSAKPSTDGSTESSTTGSTESGATVNCTIGSLMR
jgi:hypothetical protein